MMISPEGYYEEYLKGRTAEEILKVIRSLKREIDRLKNIVENPTYQCKMCPSEETKIWCNYLYLERAKQALTELGVEYKPTKAELENKEFDDNIPYISEIRFSTGNSFGRKIIKTFKFDNGKIFANTFDTAKSKIEDLDVYKVIDIDKDEFCEQLKDLRIGEWRQDYNLRRYDCFVLDGTEWNLSICFSNGYRTEHKHGSNVYPYNYESLLELLEFENND